MSHLNEGVKAVPAKNSEVEGDVMALPHPHGGRIPRIGLGVFRATPEETYSAVTEALACGYRHIDTAQIYHNEAAVGRAVRDSGLPRDAVFVTTKLWNDFQRPGLVADAVRRSIEALGLGAPDLFLLHWPVTGQRRTAWAELEQLHDAGELKAIGVSNFLVPHLEELFRHARIKPAVDQVEVSPFLQQRAVRDLCNRHGIVLEAYSPLTKGQPLAHPEVLRIAREMGASPAQVLLRWGLQHGLVVLPKSTSPQRIRENIHALGMRLTADQMARLDALEENLVTGWNPQLVP